MRIFVMCGRFTFRTNADRVKEIFDVLDAESVLPRYNIAPTQALPVVRSIDGSISRELVLMIW